MEPITKLEITCQAHTAVELDELIDLQGNLKDLTEENYVKLRNSMTKYGFSFPVFIWIDEEGKKWTIDSHQRQRTLKKMREEGIAIPPLPADIIQAKDKNEAKEKLIMLNSKYGKMTREGYDEFIVGLDDSLEDMISLPEITMWDNPNEEEGTPVSAHQRGVGVEKIKKITCPNCNEEFEI